MAPEIIQGTGHSFGVDYYALGVLLYELLLGCPPFFDPHFTTKETRYHILNSEVTFPGKRLLSIELQDFLLKLLHKNP